MLVGLFVLLNHSNSLAQCFTLEGKKVEAADAAPGDFFGFSTAISGDTLVVGSPQDDNAGGIDAGSAYVYVHSGNVWSQQAKLVSSIAGANRYFGFSVSLSGDTLVVGSPTDDPPAGADAGSIHVFVRSGSSWNQQAFITASDGSAGDQFGFSVALSGDTLVVGSPYDDHASGTDAGSARVFVRSGTQWNEQAWLVAGNPGFGERFGYSAALEGDTLVLGALSDSHSGFSQAGAAYVFFRAGSTWTQQAWLKAPDPAAGELMGATVGLSGDTAVIGAPYDDTVAGMNAGSAHVFVRSEGNWTHQALLVSTHGAPQDLFGYSVSVLDNTVVAGAPFDRHVAGPSAGSACAFTRSGGIWTPHGKLVASDAAPSDRFGYSVVQSADTLYVGCVAANSAGAPDSGAVYAFQLTVANIVAGDFDGDGSVTVADVPQFIAVMIGANSSYGDVLRADIDCSDAADGHDIHQFADLILN